MELFEALIYILHNNFLTVHLIPECCTEPDDQERHAGGLLADVAAPAGPVVARGRSTEDEGGAAPRAPAQQAVAGHAGLPPAAQHAEIEHCPIA